MLLTAVATMLIGTPGDAAADDPPPYSLSMLGNYERRAVERVLNARQLRVVPRPGKRPIGEVRVATLPVFSSRDGGLQWLNRLHVTTRPEVVQREILLGQDGDWNRSLAEETERNVRDLGFASVAVVLPVEAVDQGRSGEGDASTRPVDVLVVTRDLWSLRLNTLFEYQNGTLSKLTLEVAESNFLGRRKRLGAVMRMDQGSYSIAPAYYDPNINGSRWQMSVTGGPVFTRQTGHPEGSFSSFELAHPIWNLNKSWGMRLTMSHTDRRIRRFIGNQLRPYDAPNTAEEESIPQRYELTAFDVSARGTYATGERVRHKVTAGYRVAIQDPNFVGKGAYSRAAVDAFRRDVMPRSERLSGPLVAYTLFRPTYETYRNVDSYDLPETQRTGPYLEAEVAPSAKALGGTKNLMQWSSSAGYRLDLFDRGYMLAEVSGGGRVDGRGWYDLLASGSLKVAAPAVGEVVRAVGRASATMLANDGQNRLLLAGGGSGLRGYEIGALAGTRRIRVNAELRTMPLQIWTLHTGAVAFWDAASVEASWDRVRLFHDIGMGVRLLIPQANTLPLRIDWALPVGSAGIGFPGRLSIGFGQTF
jgi:hypothetical protein